MSDQTKSKKTKQNTAKSAAKKVDTGAISDAPMLGETGAVLGTLADEAAASASAGAAPKHSHRKKEPAVAQAASAPPENSAAQDAPQSPTRAEPTAPTSADAPGIEPASLPEPLRLPRGAFVGLRKSGGLAFSTREVVFYPDGRVAYDARGVPQKEYTRLRRVMNDGQIISLRKLLDQTGFWVMQSEGKQNPDAFAYEIAARLGQRSNEIEVFDGSIPEKLQPLLERLVKFLPE